METPVEYRIEVHHNDGRTDYQSIWGLDNAVHYARSFIPRPWFHHAAVVNARSMRLITVVNKQTGN